MHNCVKCGNEFAPTESQIAKSDIQCRPCRRVRDRAYRKKRKENDNPIVPAKVSREWWREYDSQPQERIKKATRARTRYAIKHGKLRKGSCEVCGSAKTEAHHENYDDHTNVRWFCHAHHMEQHQARGEA